ncbi:RDD family protein [Luteimonas kalidii]|uniref:RDD family protein n=1 Tax=Luteimonas kalidii TaxID=3042025 RepID=A0ABT6JWF8_9GAMM|nr:RDD family protein [Luteimonas kalidii]MDH5835031.1 RDD family protein [Luteimonas kalidii]
MSAPPRPAAGPAVPAAFLRRCAAWTMDMMVPLLAALGLCAGRIADGAARAAAAFDALAHAMARAMVDLLMADATPFDLARRWLDDPVQRTAITALSDAIAATVWPPLALAALLALAWFAAFEASAWQATPGKRALGLRVADTRGKRIGIARAALRHLAGALSWVTLNIGHLLALVPPRRQALHDRVAGTQVTQAPGTGGRLPAWAIAWLCLQVALAIVITAWLFLAAHAAMQQAFDALL